MSDEQVKTPATEEQTTAPDSEAAPFRPTPNQDDGEDAPAPRPAPGTSEVGLVDATPREPMEETPPPAESDLATITGEPDADRQPATEEPIYNGHKLEYESSLSESDRTVTLAPGGPSSNGQVNHLPDQGPNPDHIRPDRGRPRDNLARQRARPGEDADAILAQIDQLAEHGISNAVQMPQGHVPTLEKIRGLVGDRRAYLQKCSDQSSNPTAA